MASSAGKSPHPHISRGKIQLRHPERVFQIRRACPWRDKQFSRESKDLLLSSASTQSIGFVIPTAARSAERRDLLLLSASTQSIRFVIPTVARSAERRDLLLSSASVKDPAPQHAPGARCPEPGAPLSVPCTLHPVPCYRSTANSPTHPMLSSLSTLLTFHGISNLPPTPPPPWGGIPQKTAKKANRSQLRTSPWPRLQAGLRPGSRGR